MWWRQWQGIIFPLAYLLEASRISFSLGESPLVETTKLIWLALCNIAKDWKMPPITRKGAKTQFVI